MQILFRVFLLSILGLPAITLVAQRWKKARAAACALCVLTLLAGYEFTGDRKYLDRCGRIIEFGKQAQQKNGGAFAPRSGQYFQVGITLEGLIKYYQLTNDESVVPMVKAAIDFFLAKNQFFTNCAHAAGFLYRKTGQREYLDFGLKAVSRSNVLENAVKGAGLTFRNSPYFLYYLAEQ